MVCFKRQCKDHMDNHVLVKTFLLFELNTKNRADTKFGMQIDIKVCDLTARLACTS